MANTRRTRKSADGKNQPNGQKKNGQTTTASRNQKKYSEFKFQPHDNAKKNGYTFEKMQEAAILKLQTSLENGRYVVKSLRDRFKKGPDTPTPQTSTAGADANSPERVREQSQFNMKYHSQFDFWCKKNEEFKES